MRVYLESRGCRLNAAETEELSARFTAAGETVVVDPEQADVIVFNSCAVTAQAARKSRHRLRRLHRRNPGAEIAVTGCWATEDVARAARLPGVRWSLPNTAKPRTVQIVTADIHAHAELPTSHIQHPTPSSLWSPGRWGHTRAFLGIQEGCDHVCTYCITRELRGPARSRPLEEVLAAARAFSQQGAQEIVLTGVSLGAYGRDLGMEQGLAGLVQALLEEVPIPRLRLSSLEPWDVDAALLRLWENERLCRQLHLPLQSGSDRILKLMGRPTTTERFAELVAQARAVSPAIAITTDVITGFPGEGEEEFAATLAFVERMAFARLHVFPYSERAGTPATRLPERPPKAVRKARAAQVRVLGERLAAHYRARFAGQVLPVLWEHPLPDGRWRGWTDNYLEVALHSDADLYNRITPARLLDVATDPIQGALLASEHPL